MRNKNLLLVRYWVCLLSVSSSLTLEVELGTAEHGMTWGRANSILDVLRRVLHAPRDITSAVILFQAVANAALAFWFLEEYQNNQYFQAYLNGVVRVNLIFIELGLATAVLSIAGLAAWIKITSGSRQRAGLAEPNVALASRPEITSEAYPRPLPKLAYEPSRKSMAAPPALTEAAARVLKRMGPGPGPLGQPLFQRDRPILKRLEPSHAPEEKSVPERHSSVLGQLAPGLRTIDRSVAQIHSPFQARVESGQAALDRRFPRTPTTTASQVDLGDGSGLGPGARRSDPVRPVGVGEGRLDNPLPQNPLLPVSKRVESDLGIEERHPLTKASPGMMRVGPSAPTAGRPMALKPPSEIARVEPVGGAMEKPSVFKDMSVSRHDEAEAPPGLSRVTGRVEPEDSDRPLVGRHRPVPRSAESGHKSEDEQEPS